MIKYFKEVYRMENKENLEETKKETNETKETKETKERDKQVVKAEIADLKKKLAKLELELKKIEEKEKLLKTQGEFGKLALMYGVKNKEELEKIFQTVGKELKKKTKSKKVSEKQTTTTNQ